MPLWLTILQRPGLLPTGLFIRSANKGLTWHCGRPCLPLARLAVGLLSAREGDKAGFENPGAPYDKQAAGHLFSWLAALIVYSSFQHVFFCAENLDSKQTPPKKKPTPKPAETTEMQLILAELVQGCTFSISKALVFWAEHFFNRNSNQAPLSSELKLL